MKKILIIVLVIGLALLVYLASKNKMNMPTGDTQSETVAPDGPIIEEFNTESMEEAEQKHLENSRRSAPSLPPQTLEESAQ